MLILGIRTDKPEAELYLIDNQKLLDRYSWQADRTLAETIHDKTETLLSKNGHGLSGLEGVVVYQGPGSFTGLRIGISVANALADGLGVPIVGMTGEDWLGEAVQAVLSGINQRSVVPEYGALPNISKPKGA